MKIILKQDVKNLGFKDEVVSVKNGYANNFLLPKGMAILATSSAIKMVEEDLRQSKFKQERIKTSASELAGKMENLNLTIGAKAGANGKIFGSITPLIVAQAIKSAGFEVDRRKIVLDEDIKNLGQYTATVNLHREVSVKVNLDVVAE